MGAWIETLPILPIHVCAVSRPTWARGLKLVSSTISARRSVAPHVGAWIETRCLYGFTLRWSVAPHVGAWIETYSCRLLPLLPKSRPTWARGLKLFYHDGVAFCYVAPHVGAWIETLRLFLNVKRYWVAPHVGAWIETRPFQLFSVKESRAPRGRVD